MRPQRPERCGRRRLLYGCRRRIDDVTTFGARDVLAALIGRPARPRENPRRTDYGCGRDQLKTSVQPESETLYSTLRFLLCCALRLLSQTGGFSFYRLIFRGILVLYAWHIKLVLNRRKRQTPRSRMETSATSPTSSTSCG